MFKEVFKKLRAGKGLQKLTIVELESRAETLASSSDSERTVVSVILAEVKLRREKCSEPIEQARLAKLESMLTTWLEADRRTLGRGPGSNFRGGGACMCATSEIIPAGESQHRAQDRRTHDQRPLTSLSRNRAGESDLPSD
jgi:hypothetical protein